MKSKYLKPISQNLGEIIPVARGVCKSGGSAYPGAPGGTGNCNPGGVANSAGACNAGGTASGACNYGSVPIYRPPGT